MGESEVTKYSWDIGRVTGNMDMDKSSDSFGLEDNLDTEFALFVRNNTGSHYGYSFGLKLMDLGGLCFVNVRVKIWIQSSTGTKGDDHIVEKQTFETVGDTCEFTIPSRGNDYNVSNHSCNYGNSLTIHCELEWLNEPSPYATEMPKAVQPLRQLVYEAYEKGIGADVIIQAGGKDFKVSSLILVSQSEVLEKMLSGKFKEASSKVIPIKGVTAHAMEAFIRYLHQGTVEDDDPIEDLFELAGKYIISDLKIRCAHLMTKDLSVENAVSRLVLSLLHKEERLKLYIQRFIAKTGPNTQTSVYTSEVWREYLNSQTST